MSSANVKRNYSLNYNYTDKNVLMVQGLSPLLHYINYDIITILFIFSIQKSNINVSILERKRKVEIS